MQVELPANTRVEYKYVIMEEQVPLWHMHKHGCLGLNLTPGSLYSASVHRHKA